MEPERNERIEVRTGNEIDGPARAAVAAVRPAARDELLPPKAHTSAPAVAGGYADVSFVNEHG
jgi:hypothetical protein